ncbi:UxaA family hydrolase [Effusibacillus dendaii]|uniref:D-galactarate dehydratase n=1 Tax=Effusibacillus dendaii TaxID=2743772 RepID=A0A7I8DE89_9BACL|nr:UxaA family hydrolase [Effusibacillus dendaii]BCJ87602.1 D-galactarate dehydratase [Effusibacillus dendaii]
MENNWKVVMMKPDDNVAVALGEIPSGTTVRVTCQDRVFDLELIDPIEFGHKFAVAPIRKGEDVIKYGEVIGVASQDIATGQHVHVHNVEGKRGRGDKANAK